MHKLNYVQFKLKNGCDGMGFFLTAVKQQQISPQPTAQTRFGA